MPEKTYTLHTAELTLIRNALRHRSTEVDKGTAADLLALRERLFGTESVVITYPDTEPFDPDAPDLGSLAL